MVENGLIAKRLCFFSALRAQPFGFTQRLKNLRILRMKQKYLSLPQTLTLICRGI